MTTGLHHVTALTRRVQANVDFYAGFLGLRLVKRTGGFEDANQLHLFYGDAAGAPGSLVTFLVWEDGGPGRAGHGAPGEIALAVPADSIGLWLTRALAAHVPVEGPLREFGETVLRLKDPDGIIVKLVGADLPATAPLGPVEAPRRLRAVTLFTERPDETAAFVARFGYREAAREGAVRRLVSDTDALDIRDATGFWEAAAGTGGIDHVAFRAPDVAAVAAMEAALAPAEPTALHDRTYFTSLYVREPGGSLLEYATDGPGFAVDEAPGHLGETLFVPVDDPRRAADLRVMLPQFALPGAPRLPQRDLPFVHRIFTPEEPDGTTLVLLHGSGGNEADLLPFAHRVNPRATLVALRGRAVEEGTPRWFRREGLMRFDQDDIRAEAEAFDAFLTEARRAYGLDPDGLSVIGYSNGAAFLGAVLQLYPGAVRRAVLLRPAAALENPPAADLAGTRVLALTGARDFFRAEAPKLTAALAAAGAEVTLRALDAGHEITTADEAAVQHWMTGETDD